MLTTRQRRRLKSLAHHLEPTIRIGRSRLTRGLIAETDRSLEAHELIKVKVEMEGSAERRAAAQSLATASNAELVGTVGKIAILYRRRLEDDPSITLS
jgi:RNA-binding protein